MTGIVFVIKSRIGLKFTKGYREKFVLTFPELFSGHIFTLQ